MVTSDCRTVDEYLDTLPEDRMHTLAVLRDLITSTAPNAVETMKYGMPTYELDGSLLCGMNAQKQYTSFYGGVVELVSSHKAKLVGASVGKSCVRFRRLKPELLDAIKILLEESVRHIQIK